MCPDLDAIAIVMLCVGFAAGVMLSATIRFHSRSHSNDGRKSGERDR
jgi:hypothetical protein